MLVIDYRKPKGLRIFPKLKQRKNTKIYDALKEMYVHTLYSIKKITSANLDKNSLYTRFKLIQMIAINIIFAHFIEM